MERQLLGHCSAGQRKEQEEGKETSFPCVEQSAGSCWVPWEQAGRRREGSGCLSGWTYIKLVNVNGREIEASFVAALMNRLLATGKLFF